MLKITIPEYELFNEENNTFITSKEQTIQLEHSLVSLYKWESKWKKPYLSKKEKTIKETIDYIRCMTITQNVKDETFNCVTNENIREIQNYIDDEMTATIINKKEKNTVNNQIITAEIIYYWMISLNIPFECQKWHLNKLLTLINVCNIKNSPPKKKSGKEIMSRNRALNEARKKELNTKG
jgi:hypothetical protein